MERGCSPCRGYSVNDLELGAMPRTHGKAGGVSSALAFILHFTHRPFCRSLNKTKDGVRGMGKRKDLTERERYAIEAYRNDKKSVREIADLLGRHYQTIYREIRRGTVEMLDSELRTYKKDCADTGQAKADLNKAEKGREPKVGNDLAFIRFVEKMILEERYSPEAVLLHIKKNGLKFKMEVCLNTLYNYVDKGLFLNVTNKHLPVKSKRKKRNMRKISKISKNNIKGRSIEERAKEIMERNDFGHWEMDTVVGCQGGNKDCLLVLTERKTRYEYIFKIPDKSQCSVVKVLDDLERAYGAENFVKTFKTITMDNGTEFLDMIGVERSALVRDQKRTIAYYCHPYCSFERGSNENQNKMIRRHIEKGADIAVYSDEEVKRVETWMNDYPRPMFGGLSSREMLEKEIA